MSIEEVIKAAVMTDPKSKDDEKELDEEQEFENRERVVFEKTKRQQEQKEYLNRLFVVIESYFRHFWTLVLSVLKTEFLDEKEKTRLDFNLGREKVIFLVAWFM